MKIKTKDTVNQTLRLYRWNVSEQWRQNTLDASFEREVYHKGNLRIFQSAHCDGESVIFETPAYTLTIGKHAVSDLSGRQAQKTNLYGINIYTTDMESHVYMSEEDDTGWQHISGNRDMLFHFLEKIPDKYLLIAKDEQGTYVSSHWEKTNRFPFVRATHRRMKD